MSNGDWTWELASKAQDDLVTLNPHEQDRILDKLDEIVDSPLRDPPEYDEPLRDSPRKKVRIGEFRLAVSYPRLKRWACRWTPTLCWRSCQPG